MLENEFLQAYERYCDAIFRHCFFRLFDREKALDLTQTVFMKTWEYIQGGRKIQNYKSFLYQVANNLIIDNSRKKTSLSLDQLTEQGFDPGEDETGFFQARTDTNLILGILADVDEEAKNLLVLRYLDDLGPKEIGELLGLSENVVSVRLNRAIKKVQKLLSSKL